MSLLRKRERGRGGCSGPPGLLEAEGLSTGMDSHAQSLLVPRKSSTNTVTLAMISGSEDTLPGPAIRKHRKPDRGPKKGSKQV